MTSYSFGDLVLVPFPFTDQTASKRRPAVVISSAGLHAEGIDLVIMAVTSQLRSESSLEVDVRAWKRAGLLGPSVIKPVIATIERKLVIKNIGKLHGEDLDELRAALRRVIG
jgi:mRNA interferase MazF